MRDFINGFLEIPVGIRFTIVLFAILVLYCIFGKLLFRLLSLVPFVLKALFCGLYLLIDIPVSLLHRMFGGAFAAIDQSTARISGKIYGIMDKCYAKLHNPQTIYSGRVFLIFLVLGVYFVIPPFINFNEGIFTFWQKGYIETESKIVDFIMKRL